MIFFYFIYFSNFEINLTIAIYCHLACLIIFVFFWLAQIDRKNQFAQAKNDAHASALLVLFINSTFHVFIAKFKNDNNSSKRVSNFIV